MAKKKEESSAPKEMKLPEGYEVVSDEQVEIVGWFKPAEDLCPIMIAGEYVKTMFGIGNYNTTAHVVKLDLPLEGVYSIQEEEEVSAPAGSCIGFDDAAFLEPLARMRPGQKLVITFEGKKPIKGGTQTMWIGKVAVPKGERERLDRKGPGRNSSRQPSGGNIPF